MGRRIFSGGDGDREVVTKWLNDWKMKWWMK